MAKHVVTRDDLEMFAAVVASAAGDAAYRRIMAYVRKREKDGWIETAEVEHIVLSGASFDFFDDPRVQDRLKKLVPDSGS